MPALRLRPSPPQNPGPPEVQAWLDRLVEQAAVKGPAAADIRDELTGHVHDRVADLISRGVPRAEAQDRAF